MLRNMVTSLFRHERIETSVIKAKEARRLAERLITFAKRGDLHARRQVARVVSDHEVLQKLFDVLAERYRTRTGGYTRIIRHNLRLGDAGEMGFLELVDAELPRAVTEEGKKEKGAAKEKAAPAAAEEKKSKKGRKPKKEKEPKEEKAETKKAKKKTAKKKTEKAPKKKKAAKKKK
jgi:large subunit ribosomal protein L17